MLNKNTIEQLKEAGIAKGMCASGHDNLKENLNIGQLSELYVKSIDFCISNDYPNLNFFRTNFKGLCEPYGIFIDDDVKSRNAQVTVLNGDCRGFLEYDKYAVTRIFVRHTSKISVNASEHSIVTIDAFDTSKLVVATSGDAGVSVNLYGNAKIVECVGTGIKVKFMQRETY
jgi:hypothetical protein